MVVWEEVGKQLRTAPRSIFPKPSFALKMPSTGRTPITIKVRYNPIVITRSVMDKNINIAAGVKRVEKRTQQLISSPRADRRGVANGERSDVYPSSKQTVAVCAFPLGDQFPQGDPALSSGFPSPKRTVDVCVPFGLPGWVSTEFYRPEGWPTRGYMLAIGR